MATLHKIVLAIAGSLNNGTSSPAPQGNRALRNKTTALASAVNADTATQEGNMITKEEVIGLVMAAAKVLEKNPNRLAFAKLVVWTSNPPPSINSQKQPTTNSSIKPT